MKVQFKRILVALSRHHSAREVFERSLALAQQNHSCLILTHCTSLKIWEQMGTLIDAGCGLVSPTKLHQLEQQHQQEIEDAYQWLVAYVMEAQAQGVSAEIIHQVGEVPEQICNLAQESNADLIVIGRPKKLSLKQRLFGDKMTHLVSDAPCSVMVVQTGHIPPGLPRSWASKPDRKASVELRGGWVECLAHHRSPIALIL